MFHTIFLPIIVDIIWKLLRQVDLELEKKLYKSVKLLENTFDQYLLSQFPKVSAFNAEMRRTVRDIHGIPIESSL